MTMDVFDLMATISLDSSKYEKGLKNAEKMSDKFKNAVKGATKVVGAVSAGVTAGGTALFGMANKASSATDRIDKMSQKIGLSREAFQEWDYILSQNGASVEGLRGGFKKMTSQIDKVVEAGETTGTAFESLGMSIDDVKGKSREEIFSSVVKGLQGVKDETERASLASELLGKSALDLAPLLNQSAKSTEDLRKKSHDLGLVMSDDAIDSGVKFTDTLDSLQRSFSAVVSKVGVAVMPTVQKFADYIIKNMPTIRKVFSNAFKIIESAVTTAIDVVKDAYDWLKDMADYVADEFSPVIDALSGLFDALGEALAPIIDYFSEYVESGDASTDSTNLLKDAISLLADGLTVAIEGLTGFVEWLDSGSTASDVFKAIIVGITGAFVAYKLAVIAQTAVMVTLKGITTAMTVAQGALNAVMNANPLSIVALAVVGLVTALVTLYNTNEDFRKAVQKVWKTIKTTVLNVIDALKKGFESWVFIIQQVWGRIKSVLSPVAEWIGDKFTTAVDNVKNAFSGVVDFFKGIWKGIKGAFSKVTDWFKTTFQTAWEGVKKVFTTGGKVFEGMKEGILSVFKTVVNGLIGGINNVIKVPFEGINKALKAIKNVKIGPAKPFKGLISLIDVPEIPKLAKGGVIEPNNPFLAMLGDQKRGMNIETPLSTMVDAFNTSLDNRKVDDEGIRLLRNINSMLEEMNLEADIRDAVQGLEFRANDREVARVVKKYANA
jgi:phage-related protein